MWQVTRLADPTHRGRARQRIDAAAAPRCGHRQVLTRKLLDSARPAFMTASPIPSRDWSMLLAQLPAVAAVSGAVILASAVGVAAASGRAEATGTQLRLWLPSRQLLTEAAARQVESEVSGPVVKKRTMSRHSGVLRQSSRRR
jgi:hypothetical protein